MPVTRSEVLFLCGGALVGAAVAKNYARIKEKVQPFVTVAGGAVGDAYTAAARKVGERIESMQDSMAEMRQTNQPEEAAAPTA
jgi:2-keto-3-deoxy-galactonokinase